MGLRLKDLRKRLAAYGVVFSGDGTKHPFRFSKDGVVYPMVAHNGLKSEITDLYISQCCKCFGIDPDEVRDLAKWKAARKERRE